MPRPKNYIREEVVEQALGVFWRKGFDSASMSDLVAATGLNRKSLYNEFGNKESLFQVALGAYREARRAQAEAMLNREPLGADNIWDFFEGAVAGLDERGCLLSLTLNETETVSAASLAQIREAFGALEALFVPNLERAWPADSAGEIEDKARYLILLSQGLTTMARLGRGTEQLRRQTRLGLKAVLPPRGATESDPADLPPAG